MLYARVLLYTFNLSNFPRFATLHTLLLVKLMCVFTLTTDFNKHLLYVKHCAAKSDSDGGRNGAQRK